MRVRHTPKPFEHLEDLLLGVLTGHIVSGVRCELVIATRSPVGLVDRHRDIACFHLALLKLKPFFDLLLYAFIFLDKFKVIVHAPTQNAAHLLKVIRRHLGSRPVLVNEPVKTCFKCKTIHDAELSKQHDAGRLKLRLFNAELAAEKPEHLGFLIQQLWQHTALEVALVVQRIARAIHKGTLLSAVSVDIDKRCDGITLLGLVDDVSD